MITPALKVLRLSKSYPESLRRQVEVLSDVSFFVKKGELVSFIGVNGAGKTTLLKTLVGITKPQSGEIKFFGQPVTAITARQQLGFMPENPQFYNNLSAYKFLAIIAEIFSIPKSEASSIIRQLLTEVNLLNDASKPLRTFSKGMRQRLGFAQAVINNPKILLLDEPLDGLDPLGRRALKESIMKRKQSGVAVVLCSHILSDIDEMSDRIGIIHRGKIINFSTTKVLTKGKKLEEVFIRTITSK